MLQLKLSRPSSHRSSKQRNDGLQPVPNGFVAQFFLQRFALTAKLRLFALECGGVRQFGQALQVQTYSPKNVSALCRLVLSPPYLFVRTPDRLQFRSILRE